MQRVGIHLYTFPEARAKKNMCAVRQLITGLVSENILRSGYNAFNGDLLGIDVYNYFSY